MGNIRKLVRNRSWYYRAWNPDFRKHSYRGGVFDMVHDRENQNLGDIIYAS